MNIFSNFKISKKAFFEYLLSYLIVYYFFYLMILYMDSYLRVDVSANIIFYGVSVITAILIGYISDLIKNKKYLVGLLPIVISSIYLLCYLFDFFQTIPYLTFFLFGFGTGLSIIVPTYFAEITTIRERGRVQGACVAFLYPLYFIEGILKGFNSPILLFLFIIMSLALPIIFAAFPSKIKKEERIENSNFSQIIKDKPFLLYSISFFFLIIALSFIQILIDNTSELFYTALIFTICLSIIGVIGGILADKLSRKRTILFTSIIIGGSFFIFGLFLTDFNFISMIPVIILASAGNGLDLMIEPVICADFASTKSRGRYNSLLFLFTTMAAFLSQTIYIYYISTITIINFIPQISLIVIFCVLLSIAPLIIVPESIDISLSRNVKIMGIFITSPDGRVLVESDFSPLKIDSTLAMSALSGVITLIKETFRTKKFLKTIDYEDGKIMAEYGMYSNAYLIVDKETYDVRQKLKKCLSLFEKKFGKDLENWTGELTKFQVAYSIITEVFGFYL
ncbi:MAG: MFS transporter [Candidatus Helarchaeota archaeon]